MATISKTHDEAKFVTVNGEKASFSGQKLKVQYLPSVICFERGYLVDRLIGFRELGNKDDFSTLALIRRLMQSGCLSARTNEEEGEVKITKMAKGQRPSRAWVDEESD